MTDQVAILRASLQVRRLCPSCKNRGMDAFRLVHKVMIGLAVFFFAGAAAFVAYRVYQMRNWPELEAEVLDAGARSYTSKWTAKDSRGFSRDYPVTMNTAIALVRYNWQGEEVVAEASTDVATTSRGFAESIAGDWRPGSKIKVHIDPAKPERPLAGLGWNATTLLPAIALLVMGFLMVAVDAGIRRLAGFLSLPR